MSVVGQPANFPVIHFWVNSTRNALVATDGITRVRPRKWKNQARPSSLKRVIGPEPAKKYGSRDDFSAGIRTAIFDHCLFPSIF